MESHFWDTRYKAEAFAYGETPNRYFASKLPELKPGMALFPAEGEGRNAVFAAGCGWTAVAFDSSFEGRQKALGFAKSKNVQLSYQAADAGSVFFEKDSFDALILIFAHFDPAERRIYHRRMVSFLKPGGKLILEGFSKNHEIHQQENPLAGGPKDKTWLFDKEEILNDFEGFVFHEAEEKEVLLEEGIYHRGKASVIRLFATKIK